MSLDLLDQIQLFGPALPEPFVRLSLEKELRRLKLLPKTTGDEGSELEQSWQVYRRKLRDLVASGGSIRVRNQVLEPLVERLGYTRMEQADNVTTREGAEPGGLLMLDDTGARLRIWSTNFNEDLDAPARRGRAYRFSHLRIAQRVLLATGERAGLLTNGVELRILFSDPARPDSQIVIPIDSAWKPSRSVPDSYLLLLALAAPAGVVAIPDLVEKARLEQSRVTKDLRMQARQAVQRFIQELLDHPANQERVVAYADKEQLARQLWHEGLTTIYRLLFVLKLEASDNSAQAFSFAASSLWRNTFSPSVALAPFARAVLDDGAETGCLLEEGLRTIFRMFAEGMHATELNIKPLGGALFGRNATPLLSELHWGERAVAHLLDRLLWTPKQRGSNARHRVHYGPLDVEDLGRVYEALLELEPGVSTELMCRLRRSKLEVVVPLAQGEPYRPAHLEPDAELLPDTNDAPEEDTEEAEEDGKTKATKVEWIEAIPPDRFYLRVGLGRKASSSFYTPQSFVSFLVQETLGPLIEECNPKDNPQPAAILRIKMLDDSMGSAHFLVKADRFMGEKLYEAVRLCDELALAAEQRAERAKSEEDRIAALTEAAEYRRRILELPDHNDELLRYLPSRAPEGAESGYSQTKALAICKRLVAVHCLYGVDKNLLAVELAKLALWLECHAEGLPLTFLDHRLVVGDSLTGPFFHHLLTYPGNQKPLEGLYSQGLTECFTDLLKKALSHIRDLEASVGIDTADLAAKAAAKERLDHSLAPFRIVAAAWTGGVMLGKEGCDDLAYKWLVEQVAANGGLPAEIGEQEKLRRMIARGLGVDNVPSDCDELLRLLFSGQCVPALPFDLTFPEVFFPTGDIANRVGFLVLLGNPPWDRMLPADKEFFASYEFSVLSATTKRERTSIEKALLANLEIRQQHERYIEGFRADERIFDQLYKYQVVLIDGKRTIGKQDAFRAFMERNIQLLSPDGVTGVVVPSAFHANEGATGVRRLYLEEMNLRCCYSFENRHKLFEIHSRFKFALVIASRQGPTKEFRCAFYLHDDEWLFGDRVERSLIYTSDFVNQTGGEYRSLLELRSSMDYQVARVCYDSTVLFGETCEQLGVRLSRELNMTDDAWRFSQTRSVLKMLEDPRDPAVAGRLLGYGFIVLHEGKTFWQYDDRWEELPRYLVALRNLIDKPLYNSRLQTFRLAYRTIASSTNERTAVFSILPAGITCGHSVGIEQEADKRPTFGALALGAIANSFGFDWCLRLAVGSNVTQYQLFSCPIPEHAEILGFLAHSSTRLTCNHAGYAPLWREQLGDAWHEPTPPHTWPVLAGNDARWAVRAAVDAVVAQAYGLNREQYARVLSTFSHASYRHAPALCLARFDELMEMGLEAYTKKWDPYQDIPLNENLPQPVIELAGIGNSESGDDQIATGQLQLGL
jgi:hypothetical protein